MATVSDIERARARRREHLANAIATLRSEDGFRAWLTARRVFHEYSAMNVLWIVSQCPRATHVAGFATWRTKLGYQVRKGERGIAINVPRPYRTMAEDQDNGEETELRRVAFRIGHVFDRQQVDPIPGRAKPLDPPRECAPVSGDSHAHLIGSLEAFAGELGFAVERRPLPGSVGGLCDKTRARIVVAEGEPPNAVVRVLVHELAHALGVGYREYGRERAEAIVDCVAYLVCASVGLDVEASTVPYIAGWADVADGGLERDAVLIDRLAGRIERGLTHREVASSAVG